ncbi:phage tail tape measure protein [Neisseria weixii]|uniref:Phage tail tape measure protein n=1 Tax=Neisseria weixii TaxID=1853276 RepID=A0A3N4N2H9_9NEIS|nr:phage tail tape measure protein [Neisseria weixii]RPD86220.1 phage tail tape measure protein [Neisseria weixii]RPD87204.1 phage tail tape measure protein [Neisseria weixii]
MTNIQAGIEIKAGVSGVEDIKHLSQTIKEAGVDTGGLTAHTEELAQSFSRMAEQQALINQYKQLSQEVGYTGTALKQAKSALAEMSTQMQNGATKEQKARYNALAQEVKNLEAQQGRLKSRLADTGNEMAKAGINAKDLAAAEQKLAAESAAAAVKMDKLNAETKELKALADARVQLGIDTDDKARQEIQKTKDAYELLKNSGTLSHEELSRAAELQRDKIYRLESGLKELRPSLADVANEVSGIVTRAGGLAYVSKEAMAFESAMAGVKKVVDGTPEQMGELEGKLKDLSVQLGIMPAEMANIAAAGGQLGIEMQKLPQFAEIASQMSTAFGMTADEAGNAAATISNVFQMPIERVQELGDAINVLGNNTAAKEKDIVAAMARIGGTANQFGLAAEEAAALADAFIALGRPPEVAATAINALLSKLQTAQAQGAGFQDALKSIGLSADEMAANIAANPQQALTGFLAKLQDLDKQSRALVLSKLFGAEYSDDIALLVGSLGEYEKALGLVNDKAQVTGAMQKEVGNAMETTEAQINRAKAAFSVAAAEIGGALLPAITTAAEAAASVAGGVASVAQEFPVLTQLAALYAGARLAVQAYETAVRLTGGSSAASFAKQQISIQGVRSSLQSATLAAREFTAQLTAANGAGMGKVKGSIATLGGALKSAAANAGALFAAFETGKSIGESLYKNSELARRLGDELARIPAIIDSLWTTGGLEKYNENFKTSAQSARELAAAEGELAKQNALKKEKAEQAAAAEAAAIKALQAEYRQSASEAAALETTLNALRAGGRENTAMYAEFAVQLEVAREKMAALKAELDAKNAKISVDTGDLARATAALEELGLSTQQVTTGMSDNANKALDSFSLAARQFGNDADQMGRLFQAALSKMDSPEAVEALKGRLNEVGKEAGLTAEEIEKIGDAAPKAAGKVSEAFAKIGVDVDSVTTGISSKAKQAFADFQTASKTAAQHGIDDANLIRASFEQMMGKLESRQEFEAFRRQLDESGNTAKLTQDQIARLNEAAAKGAGAAKTAYDQLGGSIKAAGDPATLNQIAQQAQTAFESGSISAAQYDQVIEQVNARTQELAQNTAKGGDQAVQAHQKAAESARQRESAERRAANAVGESAKATEKASAAVTDYGYRMSQTHGYVKLTTEEMEKLNRAFSGVKFGAAADLVTAQVKDWTEKIANANAAMERLNQSTSAGMVNNADLQRAITATNAVADKLGETKLSQFRVAIEDARARMQALKQEASDATASLQAQLDELNGNAEATYAYQHQKQLADLQAKLAEAQRMRQAEVAAEYQKQIKLMEQIYQKQKSNRQAERVQAQSVSTPVYSGGGNSNSGASADVLRQIGTGGVNIDLGRLNSVLKERDKTVVDSMFRQLEDGLKRST